MNGPNLDMLGVREPGVYGTGTLADLEAHVRAYAEKKASTWRFFQSNSEGKLINRIHKALGKYDGIVYNPRRAQRTIRTPFVMRSAVSTCRASRCTSPTSMRARRFAAYPSRRPRASRR